MVFLTELGEDIYSLVSREVRSNKKLLSKLPDPIKTISGKKLAREDSGLPYEE